MRKVTHHLRIGGEQAVAHVHCPKKAQTVDVEDCTSCWACQGTYSSRDQTQQYLLCCDLDTIGPDGLLDAAYDRASPFHAAVADEVDRIEIDHRQSPFSAITVVLDGSSSDAPVIEVASQVIQRLQVPAKVVVADSVGAVTRTRIAEQARRRFPRGSDLRLAAAQRQVAQSQRKESTLVVIGKPANQAPTEHATAELLAHSAATLHVCRKIPLP